MALDSDDQPYPWLEKLEFPSRISSDSPSPAPTIPEDWNFVLQHEPHKVVDWLRFLHVQRRVEIRALLRAFVDSLGEPTTNLSKMYWPYQWSFYEDTQLPSVLGDIFWDLWRGGASSGFDDDDEVRNIALVPIFMHSMSSPPESVV